MRLSSGCSHKCIRKKHIDVGANDDGPSPIKECIKSENKNRGKMSTERVSFGLNSLIPEAYRSKAEAFAKCLQHKLLSLGKIDASTTSYDDSTRLTEEETQNGAGVVAGKATNFLESASSRTGRFIDKTDDSDEEFCSHSESENGDCTEQKKPEDTRQRKLTSMSSEDSTVESWSSCQENLTDFEKYDSESEEVNHFASQIKGSPKLKSFNIRSKRKELREKSWKRNSRKTHSSSTESIDSESIKQTPAFDNFESESNSQYILLEPEDVDVPHRILRESSSTSNLEKHFSRRENVRGLEGEKSAALVTSSPSLETQHDVIVTELINSRLQFAEVESDSEENQFVEVESVKDFSANAVVKQVKQIGDVIVECSDDCSNSEVAGNWCCESVIISSVEILGEAPPKEGRGGSEKGVERVDKRIETAKKENENEEGEGEGEEEVLNSGSKMRRCSSLKTWKTPPGTPGSKKIVRFADALGLDLADVRTFLDEIPKIPSSAFEDLHFELPQSERFPPPPTPTLVPLFHHPGTSMDFLEKVQNQKICLESIVVTDVGVLTVTGYVRVRNMSFHKSVHVRYSLNGWHSFSDLQATYVPDSCDGLFDKFSFVLYGHTLKIGEKLEFALRLECCGVQYWDNNGGMNYAFSCQPQTRATNFFSPLNTNQADPWFDFY